MDNILCRRAGERVKEMRKQRDLTRDQLAEKSGISSKFIYEVEQGKKKFSAETLCRLAVALDVSCDYLMLGRMNVDQGEIGITEVISLFNGRQQKKLVPILKTMYELMVLKEKENSFE